MLLWHLPDTSSSSSSSFIHHPSCCTPSPSHPTTAPSSCCCTCPALLQTRNHLALSISCRREAFVVPFITGTVPAWSDACFSPIQWDSPPKCDGDQGWQVVCSAATDAEGWIYGTAFDHLQYDRPGGRASKRVNDRVRSRLWRRVQQQQVRVMRQSLVHTCYRMVSPTHMN